MLVIKHSFKFLKASLCLFKTWFSTINTGMGMLFFPLQIIFLTQCHNYILAYSDLDYKLIRQPSKYERVPG